MSVPLMVLMRYDDAAVVEDISQIPVRARTDEQLVAQAQSGDVDSFEELVRRYRNDVYALSYHYLRNREEAWDLSQEVFIKAYRSLGGFRGDSGFKTWLMRITANQCKDQLKKRRLAVVDLGEEDTEQFAGDGPNAGQQVDAKELGLAIEKAVNSLPEIHRTAFILREYQDLSYQEMADVMQCNIGTVMSRLHHARKKLQQTLRGMGVLEGEDHGN
jgi:RNA polymerase sigma-70 factor (ECF subfamily)